MKVGYIAIGMVLGAGIVGGIFLITRKAPEALWQVGDVLWCECYGDPGEFYISDIRQVDGTSEYHIWEGSPPNLLSDGGWVTEDFLLAAPMSCTLTPTLSHQGRAVINR